MFENPPTPRSTFRHFLAAVLLASLWLSGPVSGQIFNVTIVTYNVQQLPSPHEQNGHFFDENGDPIDDIERAFRIAQNIDAVRPDIVVLNEVFDEDSRDLISEILDEGGFYPFHIDKIGAGFPEEDSGLMLFSRFPFLPMELDEEHTYGCGDVEIINGGVFSDCPEELVGFTEFHCDGLYGWDLANQPDCVTDKGAGIVQVLLPTGEPLFVVFSHFIATYSKDDEAIKCVKADDHRKAFDQVEDLVKDAAEVPVGPGGSTLVFAPDSVQVVMVGDFNIDGNPFRAGGSTCQLDEWPLSFDPAVSLGGFASCGALDSGLCGSSRILVDAWGFDTSVDDLGRTNGMSFSTDVDDTSAAAKATGQRLDYILYRRQSPSVPTLHPDPMMPQHLTIRWDIAGSQGRLSDHLPVGVDLLMPPTDFFVPFVTPRVAFDLLVPTQGDPPTTPLSITVRGQMQWIRLDGPAGTYSLNSFGALSTGFEVYKPTDLTRPIQPRKSQTRRGFEYLLDNPPYFVRTFAKNPDGSHNRTATGSYFFKVHRHLCASRVDACYLRVASPGADVIWPSTPVGSDDSFWFKFDADDGAPSRSPFQEFTVKATTAPAAVPAFDVTVIDETTLLPLSNLAVTTVNSPAGQWATRVSGVPNNGSTDPLQSLATYLLKVQRTDPSYVGGVRVSHATNFTYFVPLTVQVRQENDDSPHDELILFFDADGPPLHQVITPQNAHTFVLSFTALPQIDEREDGGNPWPATQLGIETFTEPMPLILLEDDDDCCGPEEGDYLLAELSEGSLAVSGGLALDISPLDETRRQVTWRWSDESPLPSNENDTDYWYELEFIVSHEHPCRDLDASTLPGCPTSP